MTGQFLSTPSARRATRRWTIVTRLWRFLSTPSARRATMPRGTTPAPPTNFYPRPPRGGRHRQHLPWRTDQDFYPRPPRGGRLGSQSTHRAGATYFYPRPPRGGRLVIVIVDVRRYQISIHALREEGDGLPRRHQDGAGGISIHALREEGDIFQAGHISEWWISIHALREEGDRRREDPRLPGRHISIHALREEGDPWGRWIHAKTNYFYPRPPRGGRP